MSTIFIAVFLAPFAVSMQAPTGEKSSHSSTFQDSEVNEIATAAMENLRKGDYGAAIPTLEKLIIRAPDVAEFQANLGIAYYSSGRPQDAVAPLRKALKLRSTLASAHCYLGISLAKSGNCKEALPFLEEDYPGLNDQRLKRIVGFEGEGCARAVGEPYRAINHLQWLNRDFPNDPEVLYLTTHVFSDLSTLAAQRLLSVAPRSRPAHQLYAETLEVQGKSADSIAEYRKVLTMDPRLPEIHYRVGRLLLAGEPDSATLEAARREFEEELQINPTHVDSEYQLGEMARQARKWNEAIEHFGHAAKIDPNSPKVLIGLGKSLVSAGRPGEAVAPLEKAVQLAPDDAAAHYQMSFAYRRVGREEEAKKHLALYREAHDLQQPDSQHSGSGIVGDALQPQTAEPPE